jgi:prepilin-type N-terminal cleavage/methylation domain-containing protein
MTSFSVLVKERGFTILEMVVTMGIMAVVMGIALANIKKFDDPLNDASNQVVGFFKQARAKAISTTSAYTVYPISATRLGTKYAAKCTDTTTTNDTAFFLNFPTGSHLNATNWTLCYSARGLPDGNLTIDLRNTNNQTKTVQVYLGGGARAY